MMTDLNKLVTAFVASLLILMLSGFLTWVYTGYREIRTPAIVVDVFIHDVDSGLVTTGGKNNLLFSEGEHLHQYFAKTYDDVLVECKFRSNEQLFYRGEVVNLTYGDYPTGERRCIAIGK